MFDQLNYKLAMIFPNVEEFNQAAKEIDYESTIQEDGKFLVFLKLEEGWSLADGIKLPIKFQEQTRLMVMLPLLSRGCIDSETVEQFLFMKYYDDHSDTVLGHVQIERSEILGPYVTLQADVSTIVVLNTVFKSKNGHYNVQRARQFHFEFGYADEEQQILCYEARYAKKVFCVEVGVGSVRNKLLR